MPELPDVEIMRQYADVHALHAPINGVSVRDEKVLEVAGSTLRRNLDSRSFVGTHRTGKYLFLETDDSHWLVMHFGMTGGLRYDNTAEEVPDHAHVLFRFEGGGQLSWLCRRKFGRIDLARDLEEFHSEKELGPDAMEVSRESFLEILKGKNGMIKPALMNQKTIAGLGNVYTDELLYQCGIHPETKAGALDESQRADLCRTMKRILKTAVNNEADASAMPDRYLIDRRQEGAECPLCGGALKRIRVSGRNGYFCPSHQKRQD